MKYSRRDSIRMLAGSAGALAVGSMLPSMAVAAGSFGANRVIFFLQNHGFHPDTCIPEGFQRSGSLAKAKLPEPMEALQPYTDRMHIIDGLHGRHTSPSHSAFFGALGGFRGGLGVSPSHATIDHVVSQSLPKTLLPHLCIGMDSMESMAAKPTVANLSASGAGKPIFMHSNPNFLYQMLYGGISERDIRKEHEARSYLLEQIESMAAEKGHELPAGEIQRYDQFVRGWNGMNGLRERLAKVSDHLRRFAPKVDDRYTRPKFETEWHDALLDVGISALKSGITNTLTIGSGRGEIYGAWKGLGIETQGHNLGHMKQPGNPTWIKIRQYNCRMLVKIMRELESVPEGNGTMMDNTLIVYTSNNADTHHSRGPTWPFVLLGNLGGRIKTGRLTQLDRTRPINALYATLLKAVTGRSVDRFNMDEKMASKNDGGVGPLKEVLA